MIRVGVAGWDYRDWRRVVYPAPSPRGFDRLAFLAGFVDVVEINSSFYRPPSPATARGWAERVVGVEGFRFTAKAYRDATHGGDDLVDAAVTATVTGLGPLRDAGVLGAVLFQFPQSFARSERSWQRLERIRDRMGDWPVSVEVRHGSWDEDAVRRRFADSGLGWCAVDQPSIGNDTLELKPWVTAPLSYLRLHGRNRASWFRTEAGRDERYDYLYDAAEVASFASAARAMAADAAQVYVVQNNHFRGQALANAFQLKAALVGQPVSAPPGLVREYPFLEAVTRSRPDTLF